MAPMKRSADGGSGGSSKPKHSADDRAVKRQRKSEPATNETKVKPAKVPAQTEKTPSAKSSILQQGEKAFPRGGASVLTPLEHKQIQIQATQDVLFEQSGQKRRDADAEGGDENMDIDGAAEGTAKKQKRRKGKDHKKTAAMPKEEPRMKIEGLSYKRIVPGTMVLGQVTQVTSRDVVLALPNNLTGFIPLTAVSDQLTQRIEKLLQEDEGDAEADEAQEDEDIVLSKFFSVGQYLRAYITSTTEESASKGPSRSKRHIELSINPRQANSGLTKTDVVINSMIQASVASVEDHGLVMDLGLEDGSVRGFMSSKEVGHGVDHSKIEEGAVFLCMITGLSSNGKIVKLSADHQKAGNIKKSHFLSEAPTVNVFLPGTAVEVLVTDVSPTDVAGQIMGMLDATADLVHSGAGESQTDISNKYKVGAKIKARVISTFPTVEPRRVGVSLLEHVLSLSPRKCLDAKVPKDPLQVHPISSYVEEAKVVKVLARTGLYMDVGVKGVLGFAHISRLSDSKIDTLTETTGAYKVGSTHRARVIGYNPVDGVYLVSLEPHILEQPFLRIEDVQVGQVVKGKVDKLLITAKGAPGVIVNLAEGITGLVPEMHMADVHLQHPEKKFREGAAVTARVLSTDLEKRQIRLTLKKSLVNSETDIWSDYARISPGSQSLGTLIKIDRAGAVVQFYGSVRAFLPVSEMSEAYIQDPSQHFRIGQVVSVYAMSVDAANGRMTVSCKDPSTSSKPSQEALKGVQIGAVVSGTLLEKSAESVTVELADSGLKGLLRLGHLTDGSDQKNHSSLKRLRVGQQLQDLVVLEKLDKKIPLVLSNKPSLLAAAKAGTLVATFADIREGQKLDGFVRNVADERVFVQFGGGLVGLLFKSQMTQDMQDLPDFGLRKDQSISVTVLAVDHSNQRFLLTMRPLKEQVEKPPTQQPTSVDDTLANPVDGESQTIADFTLGKSTIALITAVKATQLNVQLADNIQGRVDVSEVFEEWEDIKDRKQPLKQFKAKQKIPVKVLGIHDARSHRFLPITHRTGKIPVFELTAKMKSQLSSEADLLTLDKVQVGSSYIAFVNNIADDCVWVNITPNVRGRIGLMDLAEDVSLLNNLEQNFPVGSAVRVRVKAVDASKNRLDLSATSSSSSLPVTLQNLSKGMVLPGRVTKATERHIMVQLSDTVSGPVTLTELADDYAQANPTVHQKNDVVRVCVLDIDAPNKKVVLSTRPSQVLSSSLPVKDPHIASVSQLKVNDVVRGFVKNVAEKGLFVSLSPKITAFVRISDLSDAFIKDWRSAFEIDQLVTGKVVAVDPEINHVQLSLKASVLDKDYVAPLSFDNLKVGQVVTGKVRKVEDFGVFIVVDNSSNLSGLCHRSEIADGKVEDVKKLYTEGDAVKAVVLKIDAEKRRVNFGLKASYFQDAADEDMNDAEDGVDGGVELVDGASEDDEELEDGGVDLADVRSIGSAETDENSADEIDVDEPVAAKKVNGLSTSGFDWTGTSLGQDQDDAHLQSDTEEDTGKKKKRRKPEIKVDKTGDLDKYGPQSVADFERQLLGQPNSSSLWIQYMAFQLQLSEIGKARDIAERALRTINIREDEEKMNVWIALLNLENTYGSDETVEEVFKRACQYNDVQEIHERLASIYIDSGKHDKADALFQAMTKNKTITSSPSFWLNYATFLMTTLNDPTRSRSLLSRATQSVPAVQHRQLTAKFGALEFQSPNGDAERGRTIFEGLLAAYPKRWDLWDMLVDLEKTHGEKENVRRLFERMSALKMKRRRAAFVFRRWQEWEEGNGDKKAVERVRARAEEYFERVGKEGEKEGEE
ncbi:rRNA biogenesis protein rrp5 [Coniosporium tulheliwenetii]|uniref:rRNA biogenesis protein rrp5 n=1 Tax=Coniosporium tulheliwenetii TaxID=3383036 RepID=A0ACC2YR83_9PEZI|nr:rRNA biogenesis protein rrp5 [Cladosporium sp. JES 115]